MQKIAILGFGSEGLSAYNYFHAQGADITIFDDNPKPNKPIPQGVKFEHGKDSYKDLSAFDVVVRFPAIHPDSIKTHGEVTSVINEFFKACPAPIIGVTGTKGKGTTASLIFGILQAAGIRAHIAGNIGVPALDILPDIKPNDVAILELSSFQLWDLTRSPQVAVVLMVEQEHLNIHDNLNDYLGAKMNIVKWQKPDNVTIYLPTNELTKKIALQGSAKKVPYTQEPGAYVKDGNFVMQGVIICPTSALQIPGEHNVQNACAAITAAWQFTQDTKAIAKAISEFKGLEHRLRLIKTVAGVGYYDDNFATTPTSAVAALRAFPNRPKVIILGGTDKGGDYTQLSKEVVKNNMRGVVLIGLMRHKLQDVLKSAGYAGEMQLFDEKSDIMQIVRSAAHIARSGDAVIMSPACASFDMFRDYKDRGEQFIAAVDRL